MQDGQLLLDYIKIEIFGRILLLGQMTSELKFPRPPIIIDRLEFIKHMKQQINENTVHNMTKYRGNRKPCPWCGKKNAYYKYMEISTYTETNYANMTHFDTCPILGHLWYKYNKEQKERLREWENTVTRILKVATRPDLRLKIVY